MINWINEEIENTGVDFVVFNGDLVHDKSEDLIIVKDRFDKINTKYYVVHGNHDYSSDKEWKELWGYNWNHNFVKSNYAFLLLNSSFKEGSYDCIDYKWLEKMLKKYENKDGIILFCHIFQHGKNYKGINFFGVDCKKASELMFDSKNIIMAVYSHAHNLDSHFIVKSEKENMINVFFTGHFSAWGLPYLGYRIIEIYENDYIVTYQFNPENDKIKNISILKK